MVTRFLMWLIDNVPMGRFAPWVFGLAIGRWPHRVTTTRPQPEPEYVVFQGFDDRINTGYRTTTRPQGDTGEDMG